MRKKFLLIALITVLALSYIRQGFTCKPGSNILEGKEVLTIFYDDSLRPYMKEFLLSFEQTHSDIVINEEVKGSRELAYIIMSERKKADILITADPKVIEDLLFFEYADWYIAFASNRLVLAFTPKSKDADIINKDNWYQILLKNGVRLGRAEENLSCLGYRTLMAWKLAEKLYQQPGLYDALSRKCSSLNISATEEQNLRLTQSQDLDFTFQYLSSAKTANIKYIELPSQINLGDNSKTTHYQAVSVRLTSKENTRFIDTAAASIRYCLTVPKNAAHQKGKECVAEFMRVFFSPASQTLLEKYAFTLTPLTVYGKENMPDELKEYVNASN